MFKYVARINRMDMIDRGFTQFAAFDRAVLKAVDASPGRKLPEIYPEILAFAGERRQQAAAPKSMGQ